MLIGIDGNEANVSQRVGANQYAFELLKSLYRLENKHKWVVYLKEKPLSDLPEEKDNWYYRIIGPRRFWTRFSLPLDLFLHRPRPDLFFSPGHYAPFFSPVPRIVSVMDLGFLKFPQQFKTKDFFQLKFWTASSINSAKHILAISQKTKDDIIETYKIASDKITVTYLGYDKDRFNQKVSSKEIERVKKKYQISGNYILFLSTLKPGKNIEGLIQAFSLLEDKSLRLVVAGKKGWLFNSIFEKVKALGLAERVIFTDFVPDEEVPGLVAGANVFCLPSFWEGFGIPVVEAMACGVPVVVSNVGSLPEVAGEAGVVIDPNSPENIAQGLNAALKEREELIKKGLERAKKFSWEYCAQQTLKVLENIK